MHSEYWASWTHDLANLSLTNKVSDSYFPNEDFKASVRFRLPQLSPRIYHISNKPLSFMIQSGYWKEKKRKEKKPFLSLTQPNPRYRDFHYRFQSQCNCQITGYTKVHANPLHAIIIFILHMDSQNLLHYPRSSPILLPPRLMAGHCIFASWVCEPTTFLDWTYYIVHSENLSYNETAQLELHQTKLYSITYIYKFVIMSISD